MARSSPVQMAEISSSSVTSGFTWTVVPGLAYVTEVSQAGMCVAVFGFAGVSIVGDSSVIVVIAFLTSSESARGRTIPRASPIICFFQSKYTGRALPLFCLSITAGLPQPQHYLLTQLSQQQIIRRKY